MEQELRISDRAKNYPPSGIRKMFDLAAQYPDAIKLTVGEPNFDTPQYIKDAAKKAIDEGQTHYAPNAGIPELREAVAEKYRKLYWDGYTKDHVIITVGAMEGLMLAMMTLLNPGDEILVPDPCFPNYYGQAGIVGATRSLALEVAKRNILVNAVSPGFIETDMLDGLPMDKILPLIPLRRLGTPQEVADMVSFLCSPKASYITGQAFSVNGGVCM